MPSYQKKYISLKDASIISGYTVSELRNFVKIGLAPFRKIKNRLFIRFDAFEKISDHTSAKPGMTTLRAKPFVSKIKKSLTDTLTLVSNLNQDRASLKTQNLKVALPGKGSTGVKKQTGAESRSKTKTKNSMTSLIPFVQPNRTLVKILQPVAFAAALIMVVHVTSLPGVSEKIVYGVGVTEATIDYMADSTTDLLAMSLDVPVAVAKSQATLVVSSPVVTAMTGQNSQGQVAGVAVGGQVNQSQPVVPANLNENLTNFFVAIADASDSFQKTVEEIGDEGFNLILSNLRFEKLDPMIQKTFQW
ncbi:MAG: hypothetical protein AAB871_02700 [Patescibacteria group bacterium]